MKLDWAEITITTAPEGIETVANILDEAGISGVSIYDSRDFEELRQRGDVWDYVDDALKNESESCRVCAYIPFNDDVERVVSDLAKRLDAVRLDSAADMGEYGITVTRLCDEDWANSWKRYYKPVFIGQRIVVKPTWETVPEEKDKIVIEMDPGAAFGTGTHETTQLCLEMLEKYLISGDAVLDVGTGTGILAVAAEKLGAGKVTAVDRDELSLDAARGNLINNRCVNWEVYKSDLLEDVSERYSLVVANIVADPILKMLEDLNDVMTRHSKVILSGIIQDRADQVQSAYLKASFRLIDKRIKGEWVALVFRKED